MTASLLPPLTPPYLSPTNLQLPASHIDLSAFVNVSPMQNKQLPDPLIVVLCENPPKLTYIINIDFKFQYVLCIISIIPVLQAVPKTVELNPSSE